MNDEHLDRSLAAQAAAWVPPWARQAPPPPPVEPVDEASELLDEAATEASGEAVEQLDEPVEPDGEAVGSEPVDEATQAAPASELATSPEVEPPAVPSDDPATPSDDLAAPPEVERPARLLDAAELRGALEAIMLVVDEPVSDALLADVTEQPVELITATLEELAREYSEAGRGFALRRAAGGWRLYTQEQFAPYVERFVLDGQQSRLTQASLETLAVVAYKQPVSRSRVSAIRGVNCDGVMRTLVTRGLIEEAGTEPETGARLFRTTTLFLEKLGLNSVDDLPSLAPFLPDDVNEIADAQH